MPRTDSIISRFPSFYQSEDRLNNLYQLVEVFGKQVDLAEEDLIRVMRAHWVNTANNEGSKGFDTVEKGDMDRIFALYVEALGGTSLLKQQGRRQGPDGLEDDKLYRERIKGLIRVLRDGASTKAGIIAIVAANLGIVGNSNEAVAARETIRIEEFLPTPAPLQQFQLAINEEFTVENPNAVDITPQVQILLKPSFQSGIVNPTLHNLSTGAIAQYVGTLQPGEQLTFLKDGTALLDGVPVELTAPSPILNPGFSNLRVEAGIGMPAGRFDQGRWNLARFEQAQIVTPGVFDQSEWNNAAFSDGFPMMEVDVSLVNYTPGTFMVRVPWDIPGYTELLDTLPDKPREQIRFIVNKVKAAGTFGVITYEKNFSETHEHADELTLANTMPLENHEHEELDFKVDTITTPYPGGLNHEMQDALVFSGVFDRTSFDSLNTFA